ncbi:MAG: DUF3343 domain-containing protein [Anaerolineae bacterium]|nr:DUF3343 domain-containing protein [Anaerolineae bacterium]MDW7991971.1 DUF3343 domain-containing protein [Anaerolineae bacterium]
MGLYSVVLVPSTSHAVRAEKILKAAGLECKLIPVPRHISSDCGVCVRIRREDREAALRALEAGGVSVEGVHDI